MKKTLLLTVAAIAAASLTANAKSQALNVAVDGSVTYSFTSSQAGTMEFNGNQLTVQGKNFTLTDDVKITVVDEETDDYTVEVKYSQESASVVIAGNVAKFVTAKVSGAHVVIDQADPDSEITYILSGASDNGSFTQNGTYKSTIELQGLTLTNPSGAAINIENGKRIEFSSKNGTVNSLVDATDGSQKAALYCKGHLELKGKGTLNVTGNTAHAIAAKEYIAMKNCTVNILGAVKDAINCAQYFLLESGTLNISNPGDDGIQVAYKDDADREDEDTGTFTIAGGTLVIDKVTAVAAKGIKADNAFVMTGGDITITTSAPGEWDSKKQKVKASACIGVDGDITISGGSLNLTATSGGAKGISADGNFTFDKGSLTIVTSGGVLAYSGGSLNQNFTGNTDSLQSDYKSSPKGVKIDGDVTINGGTIDITTSGKGGEGIESKAVLTINDGNIKVRAKDDAINSSSHMYIKGGVIDVISTGNDGLDSNGNLYIQGGVVMAFGSSAPECGIDANEEDGYKVFITGGYLLAAGGGNSVPTTSASTQPYVSVSTTVTANTTVSIGTSSSTIYSFTTPADLTNVSLGGGSTGNRPGGPGGMGQGGSTVLISVPGLTSGTSYIVKSGTSSTTGTARQYGSSSGPKGTKDNPYTIGEAFDLQAGSTVTTAWVEGYLVGTVAPEIIEVNSNEDVEWTADPILGETMVLGPTPDCTDVAQCLVIGLTQGTALYNQSILAKPSNYKKLIAINGRFEEVMGNTGVVTEGSKADYLIEGQSDNVPGDGSEENPYSCAQVINMAPSSTTDAVESGVWMTGYIVGYYNEYAPHFKTAGAVATNILMSDTRDAATATQCVSVQLPFGGVRTALNLADNPDLHGQKVSVYGDVMKYNNLPGIKNTSKYKNDGTTPSEPDTPTTPETSEGVLTVDQAVDIISSGNIPAEPQQVMGRIISIESIDTSYGSATYTIQDEGSMKSLVVYRGYWLNGSRFTNEDQLKVGEYIIVEGTLMSYNGKPEMNSGSKVITYYGETEDTPSTEVPAVPTGVVTVAEALDYIAKGGQANDAAIQVKGIISKINGIDTSYGNATYYIKDNLNDANALEIFRGYWFDGAKFTSNTQMEVGAEVIVEGKPINYNGTYELTSGSKVISYNGPDTPTEPCTPGTVFFNFTAPASLTPAYPATAGSKQDNGNTYEAVSNVKFTDNGVSVSATKGNLTDARIYYQSSGAIQYRIYNGTTLTISSSLPIKTIAFEFTNNNSKLDSGGTTYDRSNPTVSAGGATSMGFTCSASVQINKITVVTE